MTNLFKSLIISALSLAAIPFAYAQNVSGFSITGRTCDEKGEKIEFSTVILTSKNDSTKVFGAVSDNEGTFNLRAPKGEYSLCVSFVGYEDHCDDINIAKSCDLGDIVMKESAIGIEEIVVRQQLVTREADRFVVNVAGSAVAIGKTASEMLSIAPGVWVKDGISINGRGGTQVMINNRLLKETGEDLIAYLNTINAEDIQKIEVVPYAGADYDADMTGGVVKITLRRQRDDGMNGSVSGRFEYNPENKLTYGNTSFNINYKTNGLSLYSNLYYNNRGMQANAHETTLFDNGNTIDTRAKIHGDKGNDGYGGRFGAVYEWKNKHSVGVEVDLGKGRSLQETNDNTKFTEIANNGFLVTDVTGNYITRKKNNNISTSANYILNMDTVGSNFRFILDYNRSNNRDVMNAGAAYTGYNTLDSIYMNDRMTQNTFYSATANFDIVLKPETMIKTGGKYTNTDMDNTIIADELEGEQWINVPVQSSINHYKENIGALYINYSTKFNKIGVNLGLRGEYTHVEPSTSSTIMTEEQKYFGLFPTANISLPVNEAASNMFILNYSRKIARPSFWQLNPFKMPMSEYSSVQGNSELKPSFHNDASVAFVMNHKYTLTAGMTISQASIHQIGIEDPTDKDKILYQFQNIKSLHNYYVSLNIPTEITKWWRLNANATGASTSNVTNGMTFRETYFQAFANNSFTIKADWFFDIDMFYASGFLSGNMRIDNMHGINLSLKRNFAKGKFTASVLVNNLTNENNHLKTTIVGDGFVRNMNIRQDWRKIGVSLRYNFRKGKDIKVKNVESGAGEEKSRL